MTQQQNFSIDARKLFNMSANLIVAGFFKQKPEKAKQLYKELKDGKQVRAGELTGNQSGAKIPVLMQLERSEYRGQFNLPNFDASLRALVSRIQTVIRKDPELKELRTLTNEATGGILFNVPSAIQTGDHVNVLMIAIEPGNNKLVVKLLFLDPDQFRKENAQPADEQG